jgi:hypothetical protein
MITNITTHIHMITAIAMTTIMTMTMTTTMITTTITTIPLAG